MAQRIRNYRDTLNRATDSDAGIMNIRDLSAVGLGGPEVSKMNAVLPLNVASYLFQITSVGEYRGIRHKIEARVRVDMQSFGIDPNNPETYGDRDPRSRGSIRRLKDTNVLDPSVRAIAYRTN